MTNLALLEVSIHTANDENERMSSVMVPPRTPRIRPVKAPRVEIPELVLPPPAFEIEEQKLKLKLRVKERRVTPLKGRSV